MSCFLSDKHQTFGKSVIYTVTIEKYKSGHGYPYNDYRISVIQTFCSSECLELAKGVPIIEVALYVYLYIKVYEHT